MTAGEKADGEASTQTTPPLLTPKEGTAPSKEVHERLHTERVTVEKKCTVIYSSQHLEGSYKGKTLYIQVSDKTSEAALETVKKLLEVKEDGQK